MIIDTLNSFTTDGTPLDTESGDTAVNVIDLGANDNTAIGNELYLHVTKDPASDDITGTPDFTLSTGATEVASDTALLSGHAIPAADINAGTAYLRMPAGTSRYVKLSTGSGGVGTVQAFLSPSVQDQRVVK